MSEQKMREALVAYMAAGVGNSTDHQKQADARRMAMEALAEQPQSSVPDDVAKDAARYRWLRDQDHDDGCVISMKEKHIPRFVNYATAIDNYIDAAMLVAVPERSA